MSETKPIMVPAAVAVAIGSGRPEMLTLAPRQLSEAEIAGVYSAMKQMITLNMQLQQRVEVLEKAIGTALKTETVVKSYISDMSRDLTKLHIGLLNASVSDQEDDGC